MKTSRSTMVTRSWCRRLVGGLALLAALLGASTLLSAQESASPYDTPSTIFTPEFHWATQSEPGVLQTTIRLRQIADNNVVAVPGQSVWGTYNASDAQFRYSHQSPKRIWELTYSFGGRVYTPEFSSLNSLSNDFRFQLRQQITSRLTVKTSGRYASLPGVGFEQLESGAKGSSFPLMTSGDQSVPFLVRSQRTGEGSLAFGYSFSPRTSFTWGGTYSDLKFKPQSFLRSRTTDAYLSLNHVLTQHQTVGFGYSSMWIEYPGQSTRSRIDALLATYTARLIPTLTLSAFGGPSVLHQFASARLGALNGTKGAMQGGVQVDKRIGRNDFGLRYNRMYGRGALLVGAVLRQEATATYTRQFTARLLASLNGGWSGSSQAGLGARDFRGYRIQPSLQYQLGPRLWLTVSEAYVTTTQQTLLNNFNRSLLTIGLRYRLSDFALAK